VFRAAIDGRALTFFHTNMVGMNFTFADRETRTRWQQETGEAIDGPLKGRRLEIHPFLITIWKEWRDRHPNTLVMVPVPGLEELYDQMWQTIQARRPGRPGPPPDRTLRPEDPRLPAYEPVVALDAGGARRAYPFELLTKERVVNDQLGSEAVLVVYMPENDTVTAFSRHVGARTLRFDRHAQSRDLVDVETGSRWSPYGECREGALRGTRLKALVGMRQFWWAWAAFHPDTDVYAGARTVQR
jgi:uncharacterized protein DUF3179